jgi:prepilin peptidase CpaA
MFSFPPLPVTAALVVLLTVAAVYDVRYRRIPNWLTMSGLLLGLLINALLGRPTGGIVPALEGLAAGFGVYMLFYLLRAKSAGDVKLMAAAGALLGPARWFGLFFVTAITGGAMALVLVLLRRRLKRTFWNLSFILSEMKEGRAAYAGSEELDVRSPRALRLPGGAVTAASAVFYLAAAAWLAR